MRNSFIKESTIIHMGEDMWQLLFTKLLLFGVLLLTLTSSTVRTEGESFIDHDLYKFNDTTNEFLTIYIVLLFPFNNLRYQFIPLVRTTDLFVLFFLFILFII